MSAPSVLTPVVAMIVASAVSASPAMAQSQGVVTSDRSIIWRLDAVVPATVVPAGTRLDILARSDRWYEVLIPETEGRLFERGVIAVSQVELVTGTPQPPFQPEVRPGFHASPRVQSRPEPRVNIGGFGQIGYVKFSARETFRAVFDEAWGPSLGAGGYVRFKNGLFLEGSVELLRKTGERVFALDDGTILRLGIPNTLTMVPIAATGGYRIPTGGSVVPYIGVGGGLYLLRERTPFHDPGEVATEGLRSYHGLAGVEFRSHPLFATAIEGQYTVVPDALGTGGVSETFGERDLGGFKLQVRLVIGR